MKPRNKLAETKTSDGKTMALYEQDGALSINCAGQELMHSKASTSELLLGKVGVENLKSDTPTQVLIGGLGLGFTLKTALEFSHPQTSIEVVELIPEIVEWNREHLMSLNGALLDDPRVTILTEDVTVLIRNAAPESYNAILLDIDNGPRALVTPDNTSMYSKAGIAEIHKALKPGGRVVFWSASPDKKFEGRMSKTDFIMTKVPAKIHDGAKRAAYLLYVADKAVEAEL